MIDNWEKALQEIVEVSKDREFKYGSLDCVLFVADVVKATTGIDYSKEYRGRYKTDKGALRIVKKGGGLKTLVTATLGIESSKVEYAKRGDPMLIKGKDEDFLAVCLGEQSILVQREGLMYVKTLNCHCCWNIK